MLKLVVISDTHCSHEKLIIPECDIFIHCGDFTWQGARDEVEDFIEWFERQPAKYHISICGNHELTFDPHQPKYNPKIKALMLNSDIIYLENESVEIEGLKFYGTPWTPWFFDWAFNGIVDIDIPFKDGVPLSIMYDKIPHDVNILICHGPPYDVLDMSNMGDERTGSVEMRRLIREKLNHLELYLCGHIHENRGVMVTDNNITYVNASSLDRDYKNMRQPVIIQLDDNGKVNSIKGIKQ